MSLKTMKRYVGLLSAASALLVGCALPTETLALQSNDGVSVSIHGVNYTAEPFRYVVIDPKDSSNRGGGEHIGPFSAGGIVCCYVLPKQWKPGIQVQVRSTHWLPRNSKGEIPESTNTFTVEVPPYPNGKAGELWVLRTADGSVDLVSSDLQPDHPNWPGKVKGWPEPSVEYRRERWELYRKLAEGSVKKYRNVMEEFNKSPGEYLQKQWRFDQEYSRDEIKGFEGPEDPRYAEHRKEKLSEGLKRSEAKLDAIMREKP